MPFPLRSFLSLRDAFGHLVAFLRDHFSKSALHGASVLLLRLSLMVEFRIGERARLLPTDDRERLSCSLETSVFFGNLFFPSVLWQSGIGLFDLERPRLARSCSVGLLRLSATLFRRCDFR